MHIEAFARTECGPVRKNNEDALLIDEELSIFVVADGMGGHAAGEVASDIAVHTVRDVLVGNADPDETRLVRDIDPSDPADVMRERLRYAMNQASVAIRRVASERPETRGMGTTVVMLALDGDQAHLAHVGDSRAYLFREGRLTRLTRDHTVVQQEIDAGRLTPELARLLPHRSILTQSVGFHGPVEPDVSTRVVAPGDVFVLCSDGLTDVLDDVALARFCGATPAEELADVLTESAMAHDAEDNVTVVVVAVS
jgi:serine/threonine protein phosphatase PrpC